MPYVEYPIEPVDVSDLHLDINNFRFADEQPTETAAMNYLWAEENVKEVATLILRDQYVDNELPLVVREDGKLILLEGNRRVSALLALLKPSLAPAHQGEIERLLKRYAIEAEGLPRRIRAMVLPDRQTAAPILARLHIGQSKKAWSLDEQAKFVLAQLTGSTTLDQLRGQLPAIKDLPRVVRMGRVRQQLRRTAFSNPQLSAYISGPKLTMSAFEYAYRNATIQELIGLKFDAQSRVVSWATTPEQLAALERLLTGFMTNEVNTRRGLKAGTREYEKLMRGMRGLPEEEQSNAEEGTPEGGPAAPDGDSTSDGDGDRNDPDETDSDTEPSHDSPPAKDCADGSETTGDAPETDDPGSRDDDAPTGSDQGDAESDDQEGEESADKPRGRGPSLPELRVYLNTQGVDERNLPTTLQHRWRELRLINVRDFPAAATMLMRSLIEASIKEHFGLGNGVELTGMLGQVMARVTKDYKENGQLAYAISTLNRVKRDASTVPGSGQWFNLVSHSVNVDVTGREVHQAWTVVFPLVRFMLTEQRSPAPVRPQPAGTQS
ncbi:hypothetical protein FB562_1845 [Homoserinimonas aerilata]|uniref:ParB-like nuclease family protein n=1 Tax=Homoserinimonas aerilata TaxID=1162970 RepID=A0A542YLC3_9MICO|nr:hypothetical protein [Homoserinimonas aerilata]TQL48744.1 hypothetical protein FB562_1845 [Homoserinimonas aerilata]